MVNIVHARVCLRRNLITFIVDDAIIVIIYCYSVIIIFIHSIIHSFTCLFIYLFIYLFRLKIEEKNNKTNSNSSMYLKSRFTLIDAISTLLLTWFPFENSVCVSFSVLFWPLNGLICVYFHITILLLICLTFICKKKQQQQKNRTKNKFITWIMLEFYLFLLLLISFSVILFTFIHAYKTRHDKTLHFIYFMHCF